MADWVLKQDEINALLMELHEIIHKLPEPYRSQLHIIYDRLRQLGVRAD